MRNPGGYAIITTAEPAKINFDRFSCESVGAGITERDTFSCVHCNTVRHVKPFAPMDEFGSMCRNCMKMVCPKCANGPCVPYMKKIEMMEKREQILRSYGLV